VKRPLAGAAWRPAALLLVAAGGLLVARDLYLRAKAELAGALIRRAWAATLVTGRPTPPWSRADTFPVARLEIPAIGYDEVVLEGASPRNLAFGPARLMNSAAPGEAGNVVLAGHRTSWFRPLERVRDGDAVALAVRDRATGVERRRVYRVVTRRVIDPRDTSYLQPTADDRLTLVTCWPFGRGARSPYRFVVQALAHE
jgi:sortase A